MGKRIIRVFTSKTRATPTDSLSVINEPPGFFDEADEVHISVAFSWDMKSAERLEGQWGIVAPVKVGGPAMGSRGGAFTPGMYVKEGYVVTSRGCPNNCWFCSVWRREGQEIRELPITEGYNLLDDNILACSDQHIKKVFKMLQNGKKKYHKPVEFTGGLEAKLLKKWHVDLLKELKPKQMFFAYDTPDDLEPLINAGKLLSEGGWTTFKNGGRNMRVYILCGYPNDTIHEAEKRMYQSIRAGFMPMAMVYRDKSGDRDKQWMKWQREWSRPAIISKKVAGL